MLFESVTDLGVLSLLLTVDFIPFIFIAANQVSVPVKFSVEFQLRYRLVMWT